MHIFFKQYPLILTEAAIVEQIRRGYPGLIDPLLLNAPLIYQQSGRKILSELYQNYVSLAKQANLPILLFTPTWRANISRTKEAKAKLSINQDAARFMLKLRSQIDPVFQPLIKIGGLIGPKNDCYKPEQGLSQKDARIFHQWQIDSLESGNIDFLIAQTLPNLEEAVGIAQAMASTHLPYIISFVINKQGNTLDGHRLSDAIETIDSCLEPKPLAYMVNCAYPTFLIAEQQPKNLFQRLIGFQANASSLDQVLLDGCDSLQNNDINNWQYEMKKLHKEYGLKILGGCCGTGVSHLQALIS